MYKPQGENKHMKRIFSIILVALIALTTLGTRPAAAQTGGPVVFGRGELRSFTLTPDGKALAVNSSLGVWLYNPADMTAKPTLLETPGEAYASSFSADGKVIAVATRTRDLIILDNTGKILATLNDEKEYFSVYSVAVSPDGKTVAAGDSDEKIRVWDVEAGELKTTLEGEHTGYITQLAFSPDGKTLASAGDDKLVILWTIETEEASFVLKTHTGQVRALAFSPDGKTLVSAGYDKAIRLWNVETGKAAGSLSNTDISDFYALAFSPDGKTLAAGASYPYVVRLWDMSNNKPIADLKGHRNSVYGVAFADAETLISGGQDGVIRVWDIAAEAEKDVIAGVHAGTVRDFQPSPDGKFVAVLSFGDYAVRVFAVDKPDVPALLLEPDNDNTLAAIAYSKDGKTIAAATGRAIYIWETEKGKLESTIRLQNTSITVLAYSPDSTLLAWGSFNGRAGLYDAETGKSVQNFTGHTGEIRKLNFSADGAFLWTGSEDGTVRQWAIKN
jgi:WD40 repeat protein